ncbi:MAG: hypothetical protein ACI4F5_05180 [Acutalibacteraceae bacterium]
MENVKSKHIPKKLLSVLLSIVMVVGTMTTGLSVIASAATSAATVKSTVNAAATAINSKTPSGNAYTYTGDDGTVMKAADAVYDYAVNTVRSGGGTGNTGAYNSSDTLAARVASLTSANSAAITKLINPAGTTVYGYSNRQSNTGSYTTYNWSEPSLDTSKVSYSTKVTNSVTKTITVSLNIQKYLLTVSSVSSIPATINTTRVYKYVHTYATNCWKTSASKDWKRNWTIKWQSDKWNYISSVSASTTATNTAAKTDFTNLQNYLNTIAATQVQTLVNKTELELENEIAAVDSATSTVNSMVTKYSANVVKHFFPDYTNTVSAYRERLVFAKEVVHAMPSIDILVANVGKEYNKNDINEMNSLATLVVETYDSIKDYDQSVFDFVVTLDSKYASFSLDSCVAYVEQLRKDINLYNLRELKASIDADIQNYADRVSDPLNNDDITDLELAALNDKFKGYVNTLNSYSAYPEQVAEIFTEGTAYVSDFKALVQKKIDTRSAEVEYEAFYEYFIPYLYADITVWTNDEITKRYTDDSAKNTKVKSTYNSYKTKVGQDIVDAVFTMNYAGEDMLLQAAVDIYLETLKTNIITRNNAQLDEIAEYAGSSTTVTLDNFMGVKGAVGQFDQALYNYANGKGWVDASHKATYSKINTLLTNYNNFIASGGLSNFSQKHNHNSSGVFTTRYAGSQTVNGENVGYATDIARDGAADNYNVTEKAINEVISKLDKFLTSNEVAYLLSSFDEPLDEFLMRTIADKLFTDETVNMLMGILYPMLCKTFEDVWASLPAEYDVGGVVGVIKLSYPKPLTQVIDELGLGCYPNQVAKKMGSTFSAAKNALAGATKWSQLQNADGDITLTWGIDTIDPAKYSSMNAYYTAKANKFKSALSQGLEAVSPVLRALFAEYSYSGSVDSVAKASKSLGFLGTVSLDGNIYVDVDPVAGYSILMAPIFEAIGITPKTQAEAKNLTSVSAIINAIIDPISSFVTGTLADKPITTILNILPNVLYGLSFDRLSTLINYIKTAIHYNAKGEIFGIEISVLNDQYNINLGELVDLNTLVKDDNDNPIALTDVNALIGYLVKSFLPDANLTLPVINGGRIIQSASLNKNASTRRASSLGSRINFTADKADEFYVILNWLVRALGDDTFVHELLYALSGDTPADEIMAVVNNIARDADATLAALVEIIVPQTYDFMDYDWYESDYTYDSIEGLEAADIAYLKYSNNWTKEKAEYIVNNVDEVLETLMTSLGSDGLTLNQSLQNTISKVFNNESVTGFVKSLVSLGAGVDDEKVLDLVKREVGLDLHAWLNAFGYLFPEVLEEKGIAPVLPTDAGYVNNTGVTGVASEVDGEKVVIWSKGGAVLTDGDREMFLDIFCAVCEELSPIVKIILTGEDLSVFEGLITVKGYNTYENSIAVLFEALGIDAMSASEYAAYAEQYGAVEAFNALCAQLSDWIDYILTDNTVKKIISIIPNAIYFIESNGLAAVIHNLLMPLLVVIDDVRPIIDVDINSILSYLVTMLLNGKETDSSVITDMLFGGAKVDIEEGDKVYDIDVNNLRLTDIIKLVDTYIGTDIERSQLMTYGLPAICAGRYSYKSASGKTGYKTSVSEADALTIVLSSVIEALQFVTASGETNADILFTFIENLTGKDNIKSTYNTILSIFSEEITELEDINWTYMYSDDLDISAFENVGLPEQTKEILDYLSYSNDWTEETAKYIDENLDEIVKAALKTAGEDENYVSVLLTALINDNVYTNDVINALVSLIAKLFVKLDSELLRLVDVVLDTNVTSWFDYCEFEYDEEGRVTNVSCTRDWGVTDRDSFVTAFKEATAPAFRLIGWLFLGEDYSFGTGTVKDDQGNFVYNDLLTIKGSDSYNYALVPVLEALGCEVESKNEFIGADGTYDTEKAVGSFLNALLTRVDEITADPINEILNILPNVIYFINADGVKACLNNLVAPINALIAKINGDASADILGESNGVSLSELTTDNILTLIENATGLSFSAAERGIIESFFIGDVEYFTSVNGKPAFRIHYSEKGDRKDMITIIVSLALDIIKNNGANAQAIDTLLGTGTLIQDAVKALDGAEVKYKDIDWNYFVENDGEITQGDITYTDGIVYLEKYNDWTKETAKYVDENLENIVNDLLNKFGKDDLDKLLEKVNFYNDETVNSLVSVISNALSAVDPVLIKLIGQVIGVDFTPILDYEENTVYGVTDRESFINALLGENGVLTGFETVFEFMLMGKNYEYFTSAENSGEDIVTISGAKGYNEGLVPLLEALGIAAPDADAYTGKTRAVNLLRDSLEAILERIDGILHSDDIISEALAIVPEVCYFVNAGGLTACANNVLAAVLTMVDTLNGIDGINIDLSEITKYTDDLSIDAIVNILEDVSGLEIPDTVVEFVKVNRIGSIEAFVSANGDTAYRTTYTDSDRSELITCILSTLLETVLYSNNRETLDNMLGTDVVSAFAEILTKGAEAQMHEINWDYNKDLAKSASFLGYPNNWTEETAIYVDGNIVDIANTIANAVDENYGSLSALLEDKLNLYSDETVNKIAMALKQLVASLDEQLSSSLSEGAAKVIYKALGVDVDAILAYEDGTVYGVNDKATFINAVSKVTEPLDRLLAYILVGDSYEFFVHTGAVEGAEKGDDMIIVKGGEGYKTGLIPVLEALDCKVSKADYDNIVSCKTDILSIICDRIDEIIADPAEEILDILPNIIYFINADGVTASVNNLVAPLVALYNAAVTATGGTPDINKVLGFNLDDISFDAVFALIKDATGIDLASPIGEYVKIFNFGDTVSFTSANGDKAYRMTYNSSEERHDMITIVASLLLKVMNYSENEAALRKLLGDDAYTVINNVLNLREAPMQKPSWLFTEYADTDKVFSAFYTSEIYEGYSYGPIYTQEMAQYIADNIDRFIDNIIYLLGIEINGVSVDNLKEVLNAALEGSLYNTATAQKILDAVKSAVSKLDTIKGSEHIKALINKSLGVDLHAWDNYTVPEFDNNRAMFTQAVCDILSPLYPVLKWALCDEDFSFFVDENGSDMITLLGAEGYAYGVIPILEALGCDNIMTPDAYCEAAQTSGDAMIKNILNPLLDRVDDIMTAPADKILEILPAIIYFVNSKGLDTCFKNALHAVYTILDAIEPLVKVDLYELINLRLDELTFSSLYDYLLKAISDSTGYDLTPLRGEAIKELTLGKLVSFTSKNGETAYTMVYQSESAKADMVTIIMRLVISFIMTEKNMDKIVGILKDYLGMSADAEKYITGFLYLLADYTVTNRLGMDKALASTYYVFFGLDIGAEETANGKKNIDKTWQNVLKKLDGTKVEGLGTFIGSLLDEITGGDIINGDGIAPNGLLKFFQKIIEWFKKIFEKISNLFK